MHWLGNYEVLRKIGQGASGVVYRARQRGSGRLVALKVLQYGADADLEHRARFWREARAAAAIDHPNVARVLESGRLAAGEWGTKPTLYLVMELASGEDLLTRMAREELSFRAVAEIVRQLASGLSAAHALGVVHRDLKPGNIRVTSDLQVKLLDFGLAKLLATSEIEEPPEEALFESMVGIPVGTTFYMAPEQVRGDEIDGRADLFVLGVLLYQMVCDRLPFVGVTREEYLKAVETVEPKPMSHWRSDVPPELERLATRLLRKQPEERIQTAEEVVAELDRFLAQDDGTAGEGNGEGTEPAASDDESSRGQRPGRGWLSRRLRK